MSSTDFPLMVEPWYQTHGVDDVFPVWIHTNTPEDAFAIDADKVYQWVTWFMWTLIALAIHKHRYFTQGQRVIHISMYTKWSLDSKQGDTYCVKASGDVEPYGAYDCFGKRDWTETFLMFTNKIPKVFNQNGVYRTHWFTSIMSRLFGVGIPCDCFSIAADAIHEMDLDDSPKPTTIYQLLNKLRFLDSSSRSFLALHNRSESYRVPPGFGTYEKVRSDGPGLNAQG